MDTVTSTGKRISRLLFAVAFMLAAPTCNVTTSPTARTSAAPVAAARPGLRTVLLAAKRAVGPNLPSNAPKVRSSHGR
jgi:hypothetical protein